MTNELAYAENMEKLGSVALSREAETGIGKIFPDHQYVLKWSKGQMNDLSRSFESVCESFTVFLRIRFTK